MQLYRPQSGLREALDRLQPVYYDRLDFFGAREALEEWLETHGKSADEVVAANPLADYHDEWNWGFITTERMTRTIYRSLTE